jgi:hypothetical protein
LGKKSNLKKTINMKNNKSILKTGQTKSLLLVLCSLFFLASCKEELRVKYPYSVPTISNITVDEAEITYGDSITLTVGEIKDEVTPLSTLEIQITANDIIIGKQTVRTKGNSSSFSGKFPVPFGKFMAEGANIKVYLSAINVEGNHTDTIISTTIAHRPVITELWVKPVPSGNPQKLTLVDAENFVYAGTGLDLKNDISFYLAAKVSIFGNINWTEPVFGLVNGELGLVEEGGDRLTLKDLSLMGFSEITVDLFEFTYSGTGDLLEPVTEMDIATFEEVTINSIDHLNTSTPDIWKKAVVYFGNNTEITVTGVTDFANAFSPDFFEVIGADKVKFIGLTGVYTVYYLPTADFVWVEQPEDIYPNVLFLDGVGMGRPQAPYAKSCSWNWNSPLEYVFCRKVSDGVFQATFYVQHTIEAAIAEPWRERFNVKFFGQRGWGIEMDAREYTINSNLLVASATEAGNFNATDALEAVPGVYRITIDTNNKTVDFVKIN